MPPVLRRWLGSALVMLMVLWGVGVAFPQDPNDVDIELFYNNVWNNIDQYVYHRDMAPITITRGRANEGKRCDPGKLSLQLNNRDGRFSPRNPVSPLYGKIGRNTPIRVKVTYNSVTYIRFVGEVTAWPSRWDASGKDVWVPIEASGILRRLGQGSKPLRSPLYRSLTGLAGTFVPHAYWPMEDGANSSVFASGLATGASITPSGEVSFGADGGLVGSDPLPLFSASARATAIVPAYTDTNQWQIQVLFYLPTALSGSSGLTLLTAQTTSTSVRTIDLFLSPATSEFGVKLYNSSGTLTDTNTTVYDTTAGNPVGNWIWVALASQKDYSGSDDRVSARLIEFTQNPAGDAFGVYGDLFGITGYGTLTAIGLNGGVSPAPSGVTDGGYGHLTVWTDPTFDIDVSVKDYVPAANGHISEQAHERFDRICTQLDVPFAVTGSTSALMGPERSGPFLQAVRDCEDTDQGFLFERRDALGLQFRTNASRYNQTAIALEYDVGHISAPFDPEPDDQHVANDREVKRRNGSSARRELTSGPLSVQDPPDGVGRYDDTITVDAYTDGQLDGIAGWRLSLGTWDAERYPRVRVDLSATGNNALIPTLTGVDSGSRITIANPPAWLPPETIDLIVEGYREVIGFYTWDFVFNCSPGGLYSSIGVYGPSSPTVSRYDSAHSTLAAGVSAVATALTVVTGADHALWVTGSGTGTLLNDTFTRTVSNGWGTSDSGHTYTLVGGAASDYSTNGSRGEILISAANVFRHTIAGPSATDGIIRATLIPGVVATGNSFELGAILRRVGASNYYQAEVQFRTDGTLNLRFVRTLPGSATVIANVNLSGSYTSTTQMKLVFQIAGSELRAKAWRTTDSEPLGWQLVTTDTNITAAGQGGASFRVQSGNTNVPLTARYDDLLYVPQLPFDIGVEGIRLPTTAIANAVTDTFTRSVTDGWGTADAGGTWTVVGTASDYATNGTTASMLADVANVSRRAVIGPFSADGRIEGTLLPGVVATGNSFELGLVLRRIDNSNFYSAEVRFQLSGALNLRILRTVSGTAVSIVNVDLPGTYGAATQMRMVFEVGGSTLRVKAWDLAGSEPQAWSLTTTDTNLTAAGQVGAFLRVQANNTNVPLTVRFDNIELVNPQTFTVVRSADSIDKALSAGSQVRPWRPARWGL